MRILMSSCMTPFIELPWVLLLLCVVLMRDMLKAWSEDQFRKSSPNPSTPAEASGPVEAVAPTGGTGQPTSGTPDILSQFRDAWAHCALPCIPL